MYYCNSCGLPFLSLQVSHSLDKYGQRTGVIFKVCKQCHTNYHKIRRDFITWGKKGAEMRGKKKYSKFSR